MEKVKDRFFVPYIPNDQIQNRVGELAAQISTDYEGKFPLFVGILNGCFIFASDLIRKVSIPCEISFVKYSSYADMSSTGKISNLIGFNENLEGRDLIIVEDIVDTGHTMDYIMEILKDKKPKSVAVATLLLKKDVFDKDIELKYVGFSIENKFVLGYGLDYDGHGRNLPDIYKLAE